MADKFIKCSRPLVIGEIQNTLQHNAIIYSLNGQTDEDWSDTALRRCDN